MLRLILFLLAVAAIASGLAWLADRPGNLVLEWEGYELQTTFFRAVVILTTLVGLAIFAWSILRQVWRSPAAVGDYVMRRRQKRGLEALSTGMIAIGAGDKATAMRYAIQARKTLPNEPLTHLLRAQAAQISGDKATARRIFEAMLGSPDTEPLGLRGLFLEAEREGEKEAATQFAERAMRLNPKLAWPVDALFELQCKAANWSAALDTLASARKHGHIEKASADRRRAVLLTAQAQTAEDGDPERALNLALEANALAPDLVPAAAIAGRLLASRGNTPRATKVIQRTWQKSPHPDLATAYAYARLGDSPRDRLDRIKQLAALNPYSLESPIAVATAAIEARAFDDARKALEPMLESRLTQRICTLMARVEGEQHGDKGRVREWLARAVNAPRDPAWTADGVVSDHWAPVSPVTGALDAFQWRVPLENLEKREGDLLTQKLEELVALGAPSETVIEAKPVVVDTKPAPASPPVSPAPATPAKRPAEPVVEATIVTETPKPAPKAAAAPAAPMTPPKVQPAPEPAAKPVVVAPPAPKAVDVPAEAKQPATPPAPQPGEVKPAATQPAPSRVEAKPAVVAQPAAVKPDAATVSAAAKSKPSAKADVKPKAEPKIFVSPPAPDDPGPESEMEDGRSPLVPPYRVTGYKG